MKKERIILWGIFLGLLSMPIWLNFKMLTFRDFETADIIRLFTTFILIALLLERSIEVFVSNWRGAVGASWDTKIQSLNERIKKIENLPETQKNEKTDEELKTINVKLEEAELERTNYSSETRRLVFRATMVIGLLVSVIGVRTLQTIIAPECINALSKTQLKTFQVFDVLLTGGLISGGSDGLHKILQVFLGYMEKTSKNIKK